MTVTSAHPPRNHNPHVWAGITEEGHPVEGIAVVSHAITSEPGPELVDLPEPVVVDAVPEDADVDVNGDGQVDGYETFSKAELQAECERLGLPTTGNKPDLVARLQAADAGEGHETT